MTIQLSNKIGETQIDLYDTVVSITMYNRTDDQWQQLSEDHGNLFFAVSKYWACCQSILIHEQESQMWEEYLSISDR